MLGRFRTRRRRRPRYGRARVRAVWSRRRRGSVVLARTRRERLCGLPWPNPIAGGSPAQRARRSSPVSWGAMDTTTALSAAATQPALMPDFLDPIKLIGYFGTWALVGLLVVIFIESGVLFPVLPGDTLLFVAGLRLVGVAR